MTNISIDQSGVGKRLDVFVFSQFPTITRSAIKKLITSKKILVNGSSQKPGYKLKKNDVVDIPQELTAKIKIPKINIRVLYEDNDVYVIEKPAGILSHSKGSFNFEPTVSTWLTSKNSDLKGDRAGIVHRLDRGTSGVMIVAKNLEAQKWLQKQFSTRKVNKTYQAVVKGLILPDKAMIDMPIERNPKAPSTFRVGSKGKPSVTHYKTVQTGKDYSLIELKPVTGRTHQLRVHLAKLKKPILGDKIYGGNSADRIYLHAESLEITLPSKARKVFKSPLPKSFGQIVEK